MIGGRSDGGAPAPPLPLWLVLAVALPGLVGAVCGVLWLLAAATGLLPGGDRRALTLSEAMAISSHADVAILLRNGADPNALARVRASLVGNRESLMTPLEAATASVRTGPIPQLMEAGATIDEHNYPVLWCAAIVRRNRDMIQFLELQHRSGQSPIDCATVRPLW